jgi:hypothetical protein
MPIAAQALKTTRDIADISFRIIHKHQTVTEAARKSLALSAASIGADYFLRRGLVDSLFY